MSVTHKKRLKPGWVALFIIMALVDLGLIIRGLMRGHNVAMLSPQGTIAKQQLHLMLYSVAVLLIIAIPTISLLYFTAWKYRESNPKTHHDPSAKAGKWFSIGVWLIPATLMLALAVVMWPSTHKLAPQKAIASEAKPLTIQVITMRWKWLFIYPEQKVASVNFVQLPINTPVKFELTADETPMSSFWIPNLAGQLYTMTGHVNQLNIMAQTPGDYPGSSAEINGAGFAGMKFVARVGSSENFDRWLTAVRQSAVTLDQDKYRDLLKPSQNDPASFYITKDDNLYADVVLKYTGLTGGHKH